ncbi:hypothetical protein [Pseudomonas sp. W5-01]|uniref:hypothetical protein n=1 Tax=Pseudomonas sp. W5-01 TaxID=3097454 RepID=UPI00397A55A1
MREFDRNNVLSKAINIETMVSILITVYFFPDRKAINMDFMSKLFNDEAASANYKRSVFMKCYPGTTSAMDNKIRRVFSIRNTFAHIGGFFVERPDSTVGHLNPNPLKSDVDLSKLEAELLGITPDIENYLTRLLRESGLPLIPSEDEVGES